MDGKVTKDLYLIGMKDRMIMTRGSFRPNKGTGERGRRNWSDERSIDSLESKGDLLLEWGRLQRIAFSALFHSLRGGIVGCSYSCALHPPLKLSKLTQPSRGAERTGQLSRKVMPTTYSQGCDETRLRNLRPLSLYSAVHLKS